MHKRSLLFCYSCFIEHSTHPHVFVTNLRSVRMLFSFVAGSSAHGAYSYCYQCIYGLQALPLYLGVLNGIWVWHYSVIGSADVWLFYCAYLPYTSLSTSRYRPARGCSLPPFTQAPRCGFDLDLCLHYSSHVHGLVNPALTRNANPASKHVLQY